MDSRVSISWKQYQTLRSGDVVLWNGKHHRTVLCGPADKGERLGSRNITLTKIRDLGKKKPFTVYLYSDVSHYLKKTSKRRPRGHISEDERLFLKRLGYDLRAFKKELRSHCVCCR